MGVEPDEFPDRDPIALDDCSAPATGVAHTLHRDYETRSNANLWKVGEDKYAADPSTEVLCAAYAVDDGPVQVWLPGREPIPAVFFEADHDLSWEVSAHNDAFETAIERHILAPRFGFPFVPLERHGCTMARCQALALPSPAPAPARRDSRRDSLSGLCEAARKRRGVA
jgi:DNA polymerase